MRRLSCTPLHPHLIRMEVLGIHTSNFQLQIETSRQVHRVMTNWGACSEVFHSGEISHDIPRTPPLNALGSCARLLVRSPSSPFPNIRGTRRPSEHPTLLIARSSKLTPEPPVRYLLIRCHISRENDRDACTNSLQAITTSSSTCQRLFPCSWVLPELFSRPFETSLMKLNSSRAARYNATITYLLQPSGTNIQGADLRLTWQQSVSLMSHIDEPET
jgi:hypothetical protein